MLACGGVRPLRSIRSRARSHTTEERHGVSDEGERKKKELKKGGEKETRETGETGEEGEYIVYYRDTRSNGTSKVRTSEKSAGSIAEKNE